MEFLKTIGLVVLVAAAALYLLRAWRRAQQARDAYVATKPGAGIVMNEKKPSAIPFLFR